MNTSEEEILEEEEENKSESTKEKKEPEVQDKNLTELNIEDVLKIN